MSGAVDLPDILRLLSDKIAPARVLAREPMSRHTSFRIGGEADVMVLPADEAEIVTVLELCRRSGVAYVVMGNGTNLLVSDAGIRGVVIKTGPGLGSVSRSGELVTAGAGILLSSLARFALEHGLGGVEFAEGIPGTLGGAVAMNAGAYGSEVKDVLTAARVLETDGSVTEYGNAGMRLGYRTSAVARSGGIVLSASLKLKASDKPDIQAKMDENKAKRRDKQPLELPSAGSVFKRPEGHFAGKLIMDCGLAGYTVGGAQVSEKHCGFIVNRGGASADDVKRLVLHIQNTVMERFGVGLETELKMIF